jgi:hypothetical protein
LRKVVAMFQWYELSFLPSLGVGIPRFENRETWGIPLAERLIVTLASFHCALRSPFFRCSSLLLPSLFVHAEHEEPHD